MRFGSYDAPYVKYKFYDVVSITNGQVNPNLEEYCNLPHIGPGNIEKGTGILLEFNLAKDDSLISSKYLFTDDCVIYGKINPHFAKACYPNFTGLCSADAYPLKVNNLIKPYYLLQLILSKRFTKFTTSISKRTGMPKVNRNDLSSYNFYLPNLEEQNKIIALIEKIDRRILTQKKIIDNLNSLIISIINRIYAKNNYNVKLSDVIVQNTKKNKNGLIDYVSSVSNKYGFIKQSEQFEDRDVASDDLTNYKVVALNDFGYNPARINVGSIARYKNTNDTVVSPMYICFKCKNNLYPEYLEYYFKSKEFKINLLRRLEGSVRQCLTFESMQNVPFYLPDLEEQKKNAKIISAFFKKIQLETSILNKLILQKDYLLSKMFI